MEFDRTLAGFGAKGTLLILLGSNDLLQNLSFSAQEVTDRMRNFLLHALSHPLLEAGEIRPLLLAPPPMVPGSWASSPRLLRESARLGERYRALARSLAVPFFDTGLWQVELSFDGVHFSPDGHCTFARTLQSMLTDF